MLRNLIFDMGNVLLNFLPEDVLSRYCREGEERRVIRDELFYGPEWDMADRGEIEDTGRYERIAPRVSPEYREALYNCVIHWHETLTPVSGAMDFLLAAKRQGLGVYLLTNTSDAFDLFFGRFGSVDLFHGAVISFQEHLMKPDPAIYQLLLTRYHLDPAECFFLDDRAENVAGAAECGIGGMVFRGDYGEVRRVLKEKGITL